MKPISNEKRELLVEAKLRKEKEKNIAEWLKISERSVATIWKRYQETGSFTPTPYPGRTPLLTAEKFEEVKIFVAKNFDATLDEIIEELHLPIHKSRLSVLLIESGLSFKKRLCIQKSSNEKMSKKSEEFGNKTKKN
jgi:transposase